MDRVRWRGIGKEAWLAPLVVATVVTSFGLLLYGLSVHKSDQRELTCLALNIYYEARGEPLAGQYAVAEVTLNRVRSGRYPRSVCGVVYQKNWDPLRKRHVGAFSWTEFDNVPLPNAPEWVRARQVASDAYYGRKLPVLDGATLYHAAHIRPSWSREKTPVARIGRHVFYR